MPGNVPAIAWSNQPEHSKRPVLPILGDVVMRLTGIARVLPFAVLCALPAMAETVYRSVDENGVVTFSDTLPSGDRTVESITIDTPQPQSPEAARQRLEDMRETTDRMAADRREREKHRAEMRELQARNQQPAQPDYAPTYDDYYPAYSGTRVVRRDYYGGTPWRPGHVRPGHGLRPRPEHPIARPPLRPGHGVNHGAQPQVNLGGNSQLMRPILPRGR